MLSAFSLCAIFRSAVTKNHQFWVVNILITNILEWRKIALAERILQVSQGFLGHTSISYIFSINTYIFKPYLNLFIIEIICSFMIFERFSLIVGRKRGMVVYLIGSLFVYFVYLLFANLVVFLVGWLVGWLVDWLVDWVVGWLVGWLGGWLISCLVGWFVGCLVGW